MSNLFIEDYFRSLYSGEQKTAKDLLSDVNLNTPEESLANASMLPPTYLRKMVRVSEDNPVYARTIQGNHLRAIAGIEQLYDYSQKTLELQDAADKLYSGSLVEVERSLDQLRMEIEAWEKQLFNKSNFSNVVRKSFLPNGLTISQGGRTPLNVSRVSLRTNAPLDVPFDESNKGKNISVVASSISSINNPMIASGYGLQVEISIEYEPGQANIIELEPVNEGGAPAYLQSIKVYPMIGEPIEVASNLTLNKAYSLTFPKTVVSKIILEVIQENYNITTVQVPKTVEEQIVTSVPSVTRAKTEMSRWLKTTIKRTINQSLGYNKISKHPNKLTVEELAAALPEALASPTKEYLLKSPSHRKLIEGAIGYYMNGPSKDINSSPTTTTQTVLKTVYEEETKYVYSLGFSNISSLNFYSEQTVTENRINFKLNGAPTFITLRASDWIPDFTSVEYSIRAAHSYNWIPVPNADDEGYINEIIYPDYRGFCILRFPFTTKNGNVPEVYEGTRKVDATEYFILSNQLILLTGTYTNQLPYFIKYEPETKENIRVSYGDSATVYQDANGELGETFVQADFNNTITLTEYPYIDYERLSQSDYAPIAVLIPGRTTENLTNWLGGPEDNFARSPDKDNIQYKVRGKQITFDQEVLLPITILYEYLKSSIDLRIVFKTFNTPANSPVVYNVQISALERQ